MRLISGRVVTLIAIVRARSMGRATTPMIGRIGREKLLSKHICTNMRNSAAKCIIYISDTIAALLSVYPNRGK